MSLLGVPLLIPIGFAMYMDVFLLYLILKFTKGDSKVNDNVPSIAFVENQ